MNKSINITLIILKLLLISALPLKAQSFNKTNDCHIAVDSIKNKLENAYQLRVVNIEMGNIISYSDYPTGRPNQYSFAMEGTAVESVLNSPVLLNYLAYQIMNYCNSVSLVSFGLVSTDYILNFGLMPNGKVAKFQCPDLQFDPLLTNNSWGELC